LYQVSRLEGLSSKPILQSCVKSDYRDSEAGGGELVYLSRATLVAIVGAHADKIGHERNLAIAGIGMFLFLTFFLVFPRKRLPLSELPSVSRGTIQAATWIRWVFLAIGLFNILKLLTS
jgi:hypothetical protein